MLRFKNCQATSWKTVKNMSMSKRSSWPCTRLLYDTFCTYSIVVVVYYLFVSLLCVFVYAWSTNVLVNEDWHIEGDIGQNKGRLREGGCTEGKKWGLLSHLNQIYMHMLPGELDSPAKNSINQSTTTWLSLPFSVLQIQFRLRFRPRPRPGSSSRSPDHPG